jgi:hypothetical protein
MMFWVGYAFLSPAPIALAILCLAQSSVGAILVQGFAVAWIAAAVLAIARKRLAFAIGLTLVAVPWLGLLAQTTRRLFHFLTIGLEAADGSGSPALFVLNAIIELALFLPLTAVVLLGASSTMKGHRQIARKNS